MFEWATNVFEGKIDVGSIVHKVFSYESSHIGCNGKVILSRINN